MDKQIVITRTTYGGMLTAKNKIEIPLSILKGYSKEDVLKIQNEELPDNSIDSLAERASNIRCYYERLMIDVCTTLDLLHYELTVDYLIDVKGMLSLCIEYLTYDGPNLQDTLEDNQEALFTHLDIVFVHIGVMYNFKYKPIDKC